MVMNTLTYCPISGETPHEERINSLTHFIGLFLGVIGWSFLLVEAVKIDHWVTFACFVYGATLVSLYAASAYYHRCRTLEQKRRLKTIDHCCIYLLIAGTYTPYSLGPLQDTHGMILLYIEWGIAILGIGTEVFGFSRFRMFSVLTYLAMGWLVAFSLPVLAEVLSSSALWWLILGGASYSFGTLFYLWERLPYNHAVWHGFVLVGSGCHWGSIWQMLQELRAISTVM